MPSRSRSKLSPRRKPRQERALATVEHLLDATAAKLEALSSWLQTETPSLEGLVRAMVSAMIDLHAAAPRLHRVVFEEVPHPPAVRARVRAMEEAHVAALTALLPTLTPLEEPAVSARVIVELLEALTHRWISTPSAEPLPRERMQAELERLVLAYLHAGYSGVQLR